MDVATGFVLIILWFAMVFPTVRMIPTKDVVIRLNAPIKNVYLLVGPVMVMMIVGIIVMKPMRNAVLCTFSFYSSKLSGEVYPLYFP